MAAPHVAAAAATYIQEYIDQHPGQDPPTPAEVLQGLIDAGEANPCAGSDGACSDDPDDIAEPMVHVTNPQGP